MKAPQFKVYDAQGVYQAAAKEIEAAAAVVSMYGPGSSIRLGHTKVVWREGVDGDAGESYDNVAVHVRGQVSA